MPPGALQTPSIPLSHQDEKSYRSQTSLKSSARSEEQEPDWLSSFLLGLIHAKVSSDAHIAVEIQHVPCRCVQEAVEIEILQNVGILQCAKIEVELWILGVAKIAKCVVLAKVLLIHLLTHLHALVLLLMLVVLLHAWLPFVASIYSTRIIRRDWCGWLWCSWWVVVGSIRIC